MDAPLTRRSNIDCGPLAGRWMYRDQPQDEPAEVEVAFVHGACLVLFQDCEGTQMHFADLPDREHWRQHFSRIA